MRSARHDPLVRRRDACPLEDRIACVLERTTVYLQALMQPRRRVERAHRTRFCSSPRSGAPQIVSPLLSGLPELFGRTLRMLLPGCQLDLAEIRQVPGDV